MFYTGAWATWTTPVASSIQTGVPYLYHASSTALVTAFNIYNTKVPTLCRQLGFLILYYFVTEWPNGQRTLALSRSVQENTLWTGDINFHSEFPVDQIWTDGFTGFLFLFRPDIDKPTQFLWLAWKRNFGWKLFFVFFKRRKSLLGYWQPLWIAFLKTFYLLHLMDLKGTLGVTWKRVDGMYSRAYLFLTLTCLL